jgi:hypothetical protein
VHNVSTEGLLDACHPAFGCLSCLFLPVELILRQSNQRDHRFVEPEPRVEKLKQERAGEGLRAVCQLPLQKTSQNCAHA